MPKPNHRHKILTSGLAVFYEHGFHGSGIQDIVSHAGVPKGSFYNHFKSKEALGLEVLESYWDAGSAVRSVLRASGVAPLTRIDQHIAAFGYDKNGCLVGNFSAELSGIDEIRFRLCDLYKTWVEDVAACIREGQLDGTIRDDDKAEHLAEFVVEGMEGVKLKTKIDRNPGAVKRYRNSIRLFLQSRQPDNKK